MNFLIFRGFSRTFFNFLEFNRFTLNLFTFKNIKNLFSI